MISAYVKTSRFPSYTHYGTTLLASSYLVPQTTITPSIPNVFTSDSKSGPVRSFFLFRKDRDQTSLDFLCICPKTGPNHVRPVFIGPVDSGNGFRPVSTETGL